MTSCSCLRSTVEDGEVLSPCCCPSHVPLDAFQSNEEGEIAEDEQEQEQKLVEEQDGKSCTQSNQHFNGVAPNPYQVVKEHSPSLSESPRTPQSPQTPSSSNDLDEPSKMNFSNGPASRGQPCYHSQEQSVWDAQSDCQITATRFQHGSLGPGQVISLDENADSPDEPIVVDLVSDDSSMNNSSADGEIFDNCPNGSYPKDVIDHRHPQPSTSPDANTAECYSSVYVPQQLKATAHGEIPPPMFVPSNPQFHSISKAFSIPSFQHCFPPPPPRPLLQPNSAGQPVISRLPSSSFPVGPNVMFGVPVSAREARQLIVTPGEILHSPYPHQSHDISFNHPGLSVSFQPSNEEATSFGHIPHGTELVGFKGGGCNPRNTLPGTGSNHAQNEQQSVAPNNVPCAKPRASIIPLGEKQKLVVPSQNYSDEGHSDCKVMDALPNLDMSAFDRSLLRESPPCQSMQPGNKPKLDLNALKAAALESSRIKSSKLPALKNTSLVSSDVVDKIIFAYEESDSSVSDDDCDKHEDDAESSESSHLATDRMHLENGVYEESNETNCDRESPSRADAGTSDAKSNKAEDSNSSILSDAARKRLELRRLRQRVREKEEERAIRALQQGSSPHNYPGIMSTSLLATDHLSPADNLNSHNVSERLDNSLIRAELARKIAFLEEAKRANLDRGKPQLSSGSRIGDSGIGMTQNGLKTHAASKMFPANSIASQPPEASELTRNSPCKAVEDMPQPHVSKLRNAIDEEERTESRVRDGIRCVPESIWVGNIQNYSKHKARQIKRSKRPRFCEVAQDQSRSENLEHVRSHGSSECREGYQSSGAKDFDSGRHIVDNLASESSTVNAPWNSAELPGLVRENFVSQHLDDIHSRNHDALAIFESELQYFRESNAKLRAMNEGLLLVAKAEIASAKAFARHEAASVHVESCQRILEKAMADETRLAENARSLSNAARLMREAWLANVESTTKCEGVTEFDAEDDICRTRHCKRSKIDYDEETHCSGISGGAHCAGTDHAKLDNSFSVLTPSPYSSTLTEAYRSPLSTLRIYALRSLLENNYEFDKSVVARILSSKKLMPHRLLCKYDLHGICNSEACEDIHIDGLISQRSPDLLVKDLADCARETCCPRPSVTREMFEKAIAAQVTIAEHALRDGQKFCAVTRSFLRAILALCTIFPSGSSGV